jgi:outer membrane lipoprotein-sorting protein
MAATGKDVLMRGLGILMAILVAVAVAACGGQSSSTPTLPSDAVALAASKTNDAGTYKADLSGTVETAGQSVKVSGTGEFDAAQKQGSMSMTTSVAGQDFDMHIVYDLPVMYMQFPPGLLPGLPPGKPWVKMDLQKLGQQAGFDFQQLMQSQQADPSQGLKYLEGLEDVQAVGDEDVRGVATTHYKGVVDLASLGEKYPELKPQIDQLIQKAGISQIPMEVWIDENNFVRQMKQSFTASGADTTMTIQLYDFGTTVEVSPPPANETVDLGQLMGQS